MPRDQDREPHGDLDRRRPFRHRYLRAVRADDRWEGAHRSPRRLCSPTRRPNDCHQGQGTFASKVEINGDHVAATREVDGGLETVKLTLPAIVATDLRLNEPRYISPPNIMKAKKQQLDVKTAADYGVDIAPRLKTLKVSEPPVRVAGVKVADVAALVAKLKELGVA